MGVDYSARFGIGVKVLDAHFNEEEEESLFEHLYALLEKSEFNLIEVGEGAYTGDENEYFVVLKNPFENGIDGLRSKCESLFLFLNKNSVLFDEKIDVVGGLHVW